MMKFFIKLNKTKKIILGVVTGVVAASFIILFSVVGSEPNAVLFSGISTVVEFDLVTRKLGEMGFKYSTTGTHTIFVKPSQRGIILTRLAQED